MRHTGKRAEKVLHAVQDLRPEARILRMLSFLITHSKASRRQDGRSLVT